MAGYLRVVIAEGVDCIGRIYANRAIAVVIIIIVVIVVIASIFVGNLPAVHDDETETP